MAASSRSATVVELRRMFSNLDSTVIESVLAANNGQVDVTIDHLLTMSIDTENENNIQQATPTTPLRQLPAVPNIYDDDPPPYPGHDTIINPRSTTTIMPFLPQHSSSNAHLSISHNQLNNAYFSKDTNSQQDLQVRKWKTAYDQYRICYIGDLPDDFLRMKLLSKFESTNQSKNNFSGENGKTSRYIEDERFDELFQNEEFLNELRHNKEFLTVLHSDQPIRSTSSSQQRRSFNYLSTKPLPLPTPPTVETLKTPKVRARMLQNVLTQIEQGQTMKTSMVPEESITQNEGYSYGKDNHEQMSLPPAPFVGEFDPLPPESNEEFIGRLKNMGKNSMEKFNQLARRFSTRKDTTTNTGKYSKQSIILLFPPLSSRHRLLLHRLRDKNYSNLFSFSVGDEKTTRRTIICLKSQVMDEMNVRRPDQALYKPPRRSKNPEVSSPISTPPPQPPSTSLEEVQQNNSTTMSTKSKTARPSAEPYVPPSRRSQPVNKEPHLSSPSSLSFTTDNKKEDGDVEDEEEWEKILDSNEDPQYKDLVEEIQTKFKESVQIKKPTNDYSQWSVDDIQIKEADLAHVVEVSNFPSTFRTEDLSNAFKTLTRSIFDIKWVDETHALIVFPDANMEFLQPYKTRPQTSSLTANRRICAALGLKNPMSNDKTKTERQKIETARQQKIRDKEEQKTVWDGGVLPATSTT
ncbi:unnamed protein product [Rotaria sp. Silwood2]|nr:unnamed protein product [Rotaria sp. Silwood2]